MPSYPLFPCVIMTLLPTLISLCPFYGVAKDGNKLLNFYFTTSPTVIKARFLISTHLKSEKNHRESFIINEGKKGKNCHHKTATGNMTQKAAKSFQFSFSGHPFVKLREER